MKLIDNTIKQFNEELASNSPAPGGGSTAAIEGSFGASLIAMVCQLTIGNKKYAEHIDKAKAIELKAHNLKDRFLEIVDEDTAAFNLVSDAFAMPKESEEEKQSRRQAIQNGLKQCVLPPFEVMQNVEKCYELVEELIDNYNTSTASDLGTGVVSLRSACQGAYMNVLINLSSIKDEEFVNKYKNQAEESMHKVEQKGESLYKTIISHICG